MALIQRLASLTIGGVNIEMLNADTDALTSTAQEDATQVIGSANGPPTTYIKNNAGGSIACKVSLGCPQLPWIRTASINQNKNGIVVRMQVTATDISGLVYTFLGCYWGKEDVVMLDPIASFSLSYETMTLVNPGLSISIYT